MSFALVPLTDYGLRSYQGDPQIWGGDKNCDHVWGEEVIKSRGHPGTLTTLAGTQTANLSKIANSTGNFCLKCGAWRGQLGLEPTPDLFIAHLLEIFDLVYRVLKPTGSCYVNLNDSYAAGGGGFIGQKASHISHQENTRRAPNGGCPSKSLIGIPERFVLAMLDHHWLRRNTLIWHKPSCMPSSACDRYTVDFEPIYFFVKQQDYFFETQFEPIAHSSIGRGPVDFGGQKGRDYKPSKGDPNFRNGSEQWGRTYDYTKSSSQGRIKRSVWSINTEPLSIQCCAKCFHVYDKKRYDRLLANSEGKKICRECGGTEWISHYAAYPTELCRTPIMASCPENGIVLDPFMGSGSTGVMAKQLGRRFVGVDTSPAYCAMAEYRIKNTNRQGEL